MLHQRDAAILSKTTLKSLTIESASGSSSLGSTSSSIPFGRLRSILNQTQCEIDAELPSNKWYQIPISIDYEHMRIAAFTIQHGTSLPSLDVRILHSHCLPAEDFDADQDRMSEFDQSLQWLVESITHNSSYPVIGLDAESDCKPSSDGEVRLIQISTGSRCMLIRIPEQTKIQEYVTRCQAMRRSPTLFTPFFHQLMKNRSVYKSGAELWTDALGQSKKQLREWHLSEKFNNASTDESLFISVISSA